MNDLAVNLVVVYRAHHKQSLRGYLQVKILKSVSPYVQCAPTFLEKVCIFGEDVMQILYTCIF